MHSSGPFPALFGAIRHDAEDVPAPWCSRALLGSPGWRVVLLSSISPHT